MTKNLLKSLDMRNIFSDEDYKRTKELRNPIALVYEQNLSIDTIGAIYSKDILIKYVELYNCDPLLDKLRDQRELRIQNIDYLIIRNQTTFLVFSKEHEKNIPQIIKDNYTLYEIYEK